MHSNEIEELVHLYHDGAFNRRELFSRVTRVTGSGAAATAALMTLGVSENAAAQETVCASNARVSADDPEVENVVAEFPGVAGKLYGYLSVPRKAFDGQMPGILVIHENRGLNEHIKDVTRRVAKAGYVALGIDLLSRQGGTDQFPDPADAGRAYGNTTAATNLEDMKSAVAYLRTLGIVRADRIGSVGFCAGGANSFNLAVNQPDLGAAVVYYGAPPAPLDLIDGMNSPLLMHYGELDRNLNARIAPAFSALIEKRKTFAMHVYEGAPHAFNNDTGPNYNQAAACEAWEKTLAFYRKHLRAPAQTA